MVTSLLAFCVCGAAATNASVDSTNGVYVRDSGVAVEHFALADRLEHLGEWNKAADVYQELMQKQADRVVASASDPDRYQSVVAAVQDRLCHWSPEALGIYRDRFGAEAQSILDHALAEHRDDQRDDLAALNLVLTHFFVTDAAKSAGMRLIDDDFENGDFATAATLGNRLLDHHPMLLGDRPALLYRTALAEHFSGGDEPDNAAASAQPIARLNELKDKFPKTLGTIRGVDVTLADSLAAELEHSRKPPTTSPFIDQSESWVMPFGNLEHSRVPAIAGLAGARLFSVPLVIAPPHPIAGAVALVRQNNDRSRQLGLTLGIVPVVDQGELFFQDNAHIYAVSLESGLPSPGWQETYPGEANGRYSIDAAPSPRSQLTTLCLTENSVLAVMGFGDPGTASMPMRTIQNSRLVCLDRRHGHERWTVDQSQLPAEPAALRQLSLGGTPLVVGNNVYVCAVGGSEAQFQDCYILCFDLTSGAYKWSSYIASANDTQAIWEPGTGNGTPPTVAAQLAFHGGRLFVATNVGAVAALDGLDGSIAWLDLYPRQAMPDPQMWSRVRGNSELNGKRPWTINPILVDSEKVFACPSDANSLFVYDAVDGTLVHKLDLSYKTSLDSSTPAEMAETFIGVSSAAGGAHGLSAILASDRSILCVRVDNYDPAKGDDNLLWVNSTLTKSLSPNERIPIDDPIRGRAFLTRDSVVVPLNWGLDRISLASGAAMETFPPTGSWDVHDDGPGNVLLTSEHLIIAGSQHVNVYTDLSVAQGRLDHAIQQSPHDPELRLRYAEMLLAARRFDGPNGAISKMDETSALLAEAQSQSSSPSAADSMSGNTTSPLNSRLFNDALNFAISTDTSTAQAPLVNELFDHAAAAASTPAEQVTYRLRRADHLERVNDPAAQLTLYQQILLDPQYRSVTVSETDRSIEPASEFAYQAIGRVTHRAGVAVYQKYEEAAAALLAAAKASPADELSKQRDQLLDLAESYPNSAAARQAILTAAQDDEALSDSRSAAALLRKFSARYSGDDRALVLQSLARLYLQMPDHANRLSIAIGRLEQGAKLPDPPKIDQPLKLPDGTILQNVSFADAAAALRKFQNDAETSELPNFAMQPYVRGSKTQLPVLPEDRAAAIADVAHLLEPLEGQNRFDRIVTYSTNHELAICAIGQSKPLWTSAAITDAPNHVAWIGGNLLVCAPGRLVLLKGNAGDVVWDVPLKTLPIAQLASIGNSADAAGGSVSADDADSNDNSGDNRVANLPPVFNGRGRAWILNRNGQPVRIVGPAILGGGRVVAGMGVAGGVGGAAPAIAAPVEQIEHVVPGSERIVFSTSGSNEAADASADIGSRIVSVNTADGRLMWQTRMANHSIDRLCADDDFVAVQATSPSEIRLVTFDAQSGQALWRPKAFPRDNSGNDQGGNNLAGNTLAGPINFCLGPDGSLVYVLADRICCKDLFDPDPTLRFSRPVLHQSPANTFGGSSGADQLVVRDGRIMVISDGGLFVRTYALSDGLPINRGEGSAAMLNTEITLDRPNARLRLVGKNLYVFGDDHVKHYGLTDALDIWDASIVTKNQEGTETSVVVRDLEITPTNAVAFLVQQQFQANGGGVAGIAVLNGLPVAQPVAPRGTVNTLTIRAWSRALLANGRESGLGVNRDRIITDPSGIEQVQLVDEGVYYLTGDHQLHFLRGAGAVAAK